MKPAFFVKGVDAGVGPSALQQDVMAVLLPSVFQSGSQHCAAVALTSEVRVGNDILDEAMLTTTTEQVRCNDQHARRNNSLRRLGYENADTGSA